MIATEIHAAGLVLGLVQLCLVGVACWAAGALTRRRWQRCRAEQAERDARQAAMEAADRAEAALVRGIGKREELAARLPTDRARVGSSPELRRETVTVAGGVWKDGPLRGQPVVVFRPDGGDSWALTEGMAAEFIDDLAKARRSAIEAAAAAEPQPVGQNNGS